MIKIISTLLILSTIVLNGCSELKEKVIIAEMQSIVDSFTIDKIETTSELHTLQLLNDSTLVAFGEGGSVLSMFALQGKLFHRSYAKTMNHPNLFRCFFMDADKTFNLIDDENNWYTFDTSIGLTRKCSLVLDLKHIKTDYILFSNHFYSATIIGNKMYVRFGYKTVPNYFNWLKEKELVSFSPTKDSLNNIEYLFDKPKNIGEFFMPFSFYCVNSTQIVMGYPGIDSLYCYNTTTKKYSSHYINNKDFLTQQKVNNDSLFEYEYSLVFYKKNFNYYGVFYNANTNHYVLFYKTPVDKDIKVPTMEDQKLKALILDSSFKPVQYYTFDSTYRYPVSFIQTPKGLAMPIYNKYSEDEGNIKYYIYNF